jgi:hypothetical protein
MRITRRQFGISMLVGLGSALLLALLGGLFGSERRDGRFARARFWRRGDLAG